jgi:hypothetical protein
MSRLTSIALLLVTLVMTAPAAGASSPCGVIKDARGDVAVDVFTATGVQGNVESLDIVGGEVSGSPDAISAEVRVVGPIKRDELLRGYRYSVSFVLGRSDIPEEYELVAMITATSETFSVYRQDGAGGSGLGRYVQGTSDLKGGRVRFSVDSRTLQSLSSQDLSTLAGRRLSSLRLVSGSVLGESAAAGVTVDGDDEAGTSRSIIIGRGCRN